jgi:hypothetical protein
LITHPAAGDDRHGKLSASETAIHHGGQDKQRCVCCNGGKVGAKLLSKGIDTSALTL